MQRKILTILASLVLALGAAAFAGCGDDEEPDTGTGGGTGAQNTDTSGDAPATTGDVVEVSMKDIKMVPDKITVQVGQTVKWSNDDPVDHNATATSGSDFKSGNMAQGDTFEWKADKAGTVEYVCTIHPSQTGTITVTE